MSVLGAEKLKERISNGELVANHTEEKDDSIRGASYDVHIAKDRMTIPERRGGVTRYDEGNERRRPVVLRPGEVASVTSQELFCLPWDVAGNIGVRFGFASQGALVHTGLLVHPGYGQEETAEGEWTKKPARLHFLIANLSTQDLSFVPGSERIASIQFVTVDGDSEHRTATGDLAKDLEVGEVGSKLGLLTEIQELQQQMFEFKNSYYNIILFGTYVLGAAFLGVVLTFGVDLVSNGSKMAAVNKGVGDLHLSWLRVVLFLGVLVAILTVLAAGVRFGGRWVPRTLSKLGRKGRPIARKIAFGLMHPVRAVQGTKAGFKAWRKQLG